MKKLFLALLLAPAARAALPSARLQPMPLAPSAALAAAPLLAPPAGSPLQLPVSAPLPPDASGLGRIAVVGDAGTGDEHQMGIARAMSAEHGRAPFASVLVLGDNVYDNGEPEKFDSVIRDPYAPLFDGGARFFPTLGNHDVLAGGGEAQLAYWGAPRWYKASIGDTDIFSVDTTILIPQHQKGAYDGRLEEVAAMARDQLAWLDRALGESTARHKIVYGHHPMYVSTDEDLKIAESADLRAILEPLLLKRGVKLYLSGHRHHYERSNPVGGLTHVISGAGGRLDHPATHLSGVSATAVARRHFLVIEPREDGLHVRAIDKNGETFDEFVVPD